MSTGPSGARLIALARVARRVSRAEGAAGVARRAVRAAYNRLDAAQVDFPVHPDDWADPSALKLLPARNAPPSGSRLRIAWVTTPPGAGSGGHTTMLRMVEALEAAGHSCVLHLYDRYEGDVERHRRVIRDWWPGVAADVRMVDGSLEAADVVVATSWQTAHVVATRTPFPARRLYLVQDFEPYFYPRGTEYALAEQTYRFGFRCISIGHMVAQLLLTECGVTSDTAEFGCDAAVYHLLNRGARRGVVFYARPGVARRGYELGVLALAEFATRHPDQEIHIFGDTRSQLPFPAVKHGKLSPQGLAELYNSCIAGLPLSFTNISLAASEMLACGMIPVINDHRYARVDLPSEAARWAEATPRSLAASLSAAVAAASPAGAAAAADSVAKDGWRRAQSTVVRVVEEEVWGADSAPQTTASTVA